MDLYEHLVLQYLTKDAHKFVSPQYSISGPTGGEWSCPDFVALDFHKRRSHFLQSVQPSRNISDALGIKECGSQGSYGGRRTRSLNLD